MQLLLEHDGSERPDLEEEDQVPLPRLSGQPLHCALLPGVPRGSREGQSVCHFALKQKNFFSLFFSYSRISLFRRRYNIVCILAKKKNCLMAVHLSVCTSTSSSRCCQSRWRRSNNGVWLYQRNCMGNSNNNVFFLLMFKRCYWLEKFYIDVFDVNL